VDVKVTVRRPRASRTLEDFRANDPGLADLLASIPGFPDGASVSPAFEHLYDLKASWNHNRLARLDQLVSRHNYYDCETILEFEAPATGRKVLFLKGDMDVNTDGSDGDRNIAVDGSSRFFQPQTSYRWRRRTDRPNPFLEPAEKRLAELRAEYAIKGLSAARNAELKSGIEETSRRVYDLKTWSFLVSDADPSIVLPGFMLRRGEEVPAFASVGDYAVVIYGGKGYPAIVGDAGPSYKFGEASMRLCRALNPRASALSRPVSDINVAYLVFPGSADTPQPPDLDRWHARCAELMGEIGAGDIGLHRWEDVVPPWPEPTPEAPLAPGEEPGSMPPLPATAGTETTAPNADPGEEPPVDGPEAEPAAGASPTAAETGPGLTPPAQQP